MAGRHRHFGVAHARLAWPRPHDSPVDRSRFSGSRWVVAAMEEWQRLGEQRWRGHVSVCRAAHRLSDRARQRSTAPTDQGAIRRKPAAFERPSSVVHLQEDRTTPTPTSTSSSTHAPSIRAWAAVSPEMMKPGVHAVPAWSKRLHHKTSGNALDAA